MDNMAADSRDEPHTDYVYCDGAIAEVLKFGSCQLHSGHKLLFLIIPGNPGIVGYYRTFMQTLHRMFGYRYPVWAVSHAGHCAVPDSMDMIDGTSTAADTDVFGLPGQVEQKLSFLRKHVPRETSLVLVGHSIGCYMTLEMMKRNPELKIIKAVLLFPTIERMAQTPQGKAMSPAMCQLRYAAYLPVFLVSLLPESLKSCLVKIAFRGIRSLDPTVVPPTVALLNGDSAANAMYLGSHEMRKVLQRDNVTIEKNLQKLIFYYGASDPWCPIEFYHDIKRDFPNGDIRLCERGLPHAFVLASGREVAEMVYEWIRGDLRT